MTCPSFNIRGVVWRLSCFRFHFLEFDPGILFGRRWFLWENWYYWIKGGSWDSSLYKNLCIKAHVCCLWCRPKLGLVNARMKLYNCDQNIIDRRLYLLYPSNMFIIKLGFSEIIHHSNRKEYINTELSKARVGLLSWEYCNQRTQQKDIWSI
jgi:hypothetical protein